MYVFFLQLSHFFLSCFRIILQYSEVLGKGSSKTV
jgi:hypothetical protein